MFEVTKIVYTYYRINNQEFNTEEEALYYGLSLYKKQLLNQLYLLNGYFSGQGHTIENIVEELDKLNELRTALNNYIYYYDKIYKEKREKHESLS